MDERELIAAVLNERAAYDRLAGRLDPADFGEQGQLLIKAAVQFYKRDPSAESVNREVIKSQVSRMFANAKHAKAVVAYLEEIPQTVSVINVTTEYRELRMHNVGLDLAARLAGGKHDEATDKLLNKYMKYGQETDVSKDRLSFEDLTATVGKGNRIRLTPARLNEECAGGALRGHNITIFARPECGKTMFAISLAGGFLKQGLKVLYTGNEEPLSDLQKRVLSRLSQVPLHKLQDDYKQLQKAIAIATKNGYEGLIAKELKTAKIPELEALVRHFRPDVLIVDQLKNLKMPGSGNRALELDEIAQEIRRLGKQYNCLTIGVTQAGDSAEGKLVLRQNDVEWSNTGIPGAADLMIGIGVDRKYDMAKRRMISLPKNKIGGSHASFPLFIEPQFSIYRNKPRSRT